MDVRTLKIGQLIFVLGDMKNLALHYKKFSPISEKKFAVFLNCKKYYANDGFWVTEVLIDGKKVLMFSASSNNENIKLLELESDLNYDTTVNGK